MNPSAQSAIQFALRRTEFLWPHKITPWRLLLTHQWGQPLDFASAKQLAAAAPSSRAAQLAAGKFYLFNSGHRLSVIVEAEQCFRRALAKSPRSAEAMTYVGWSLDSQGRWTEARACYERALALDPDFPLAKERYALALEELNVVEAAPIAVTTRPGSFTRFPETIDSLSNVEAAAADHVLSHVPRDALSLTPDTRIVTIGSCFAANLAHALTAEGIATTNLTVGEIINSTYANRELLEWALGAAPSVSEEMLRQFSKDHIGALLRNADVIIYTLGVAPCFFDKESSRFVLPAKSAGVRGVMQGNLVFRMTTVEENARNLKAIVAVVRQCNPDCKFVFSLSPVPLTSTLEPRSAMEADCLSKATLRVAVEQVIVETPGCLYWPAFEIVRWLGSYVPNMYGEEDGTTYHVSERVVRIIMKLFLQFYMMPAREANTAEPPAAFAVGNSGSWSTAE